MIGEGYSCLLIMNEKENKLEGVVSQQDIMTLIALRAAIVRGNDLSQKQKVET
jgi:CBS domain-containing protein